MLAFTAVSIALKLPKRDDTNFKARVKRIDFAGALTLIVSLISLLVGLDRGGNVAWKDPITIGGLGVFAVFFPAFLLVEFKLANEPFAPKRIVLNPTLLGSYWCNFFCIAGANCMIFYVSLYVQAVQHKTASEAGVTLMPAIIGGVMGSLSGGYIIQVTGRYLFLTISSFIVALIGFTLVTLSTGVLHSYVGLEIGKETHHVDLSIMLIACHPCRPFHGGHRKWGRNHDYIDFSHCSSRLRGPGYGYVRYVH
jgi:hypothetical protein